jgi:hypothetical protein
LNDKLTSAQQNALDIDHANALDKSTAGDTILGLVQVNGSSARIRITSTALGSKGFVADPGSTMDLNGAMNLNSGAAFSGLAASSFTLVSTCLTNITLGTASVLQQAAGGLIAITAPTGIAITTTTTRTIKQPVHASFLQTGWTASGAGVAYYVQGPGTNVPQEFLLTRTHNLATLASVDCFLAVKGPHGATPATFPSFNVFRYLIADGQSPNNGQSLRSGGAVSFTAGSGAAWDNSNNMQHATFTCDQNNTIDSSTYVYGISVTDEYGANSAGGNLYVGFNLNYTNITSMAFA